MNALTTVAVKPPENLWYGQGFHDREKSTFDLAFISALR